jgi:hypothetical protein
MRQVAKPILITAVVVGLIAGAYFFLLRDRVSESAGDLHVGDCFEVPTETTVSTVQHRPCTEPHDGEAFIVANIDGDNYPISLTMERWVTDHCLGSAFESYVGATYEDQTAVEVQWFSPTFDGWKNGDRQVKCFLTPAAGGTVTSSYRAGGAPAAT